MGEFKVKLSLSSKPSAKKPEKKNNEKDPNIDQNKKKILLPVEKPKEQMFDLMNRPKH